MAGPAGFEPAHAGIKTQCLTAWRRPNNLNCPSILPFPAGLLDTSCVSPFGLVLRTIQNGVLPFFSYLRTLRSKPAPREKHMLNVFFYTRLALRLGDGPILNQLLPEKLIKLRVQHGTVSSLGYPCLPLLWRLVLSLLRQLMAIKFGKDTGTSPR